MRHIFLIFFILLMPVLAAAHQPVVQDVAGGIVKIQDSTISYAYYGELYGEPQEFLLTSGESFTLYVKVLEPDIDSATNDYSAVIYQISEAGDRIQVAELNATEASWESEFEFFGGDYYLNGPEYEVADTSPGTYYIEVSSPDNEGKYVLVTGTIEDFSGVSPLALLKEIYGVKLFFEKSPLAIFQTPFVYVPVGVIIFLVMLLLLMRRMRSANRA